MMIPPRLWPYLIGAAFVVCLMLLMLFVINAAANEAREQRDIYWRGEIAKANEQTALAKLLQVQETQRLETALSQKIEQFHQQIDELEHANASLPDTACGLDAERVRLLRKP